MGSPRDLQPPPCSQPVEGLAALAMEHARRAYPGFAPRFIECSALAQVAYYMPQPAVSISVQPPINGDHPVGGTVFGAMPPINLSAMPGTVRPGTN